VRRSRQSSAGGSDEHLIERVRHGDNQAFAELYRRHRKAAVATARWLLPSRSDVDDVVADAFAGVLAAIQNGNGPRDHFRRYLFAAVRNGCRMRRQRNADADHRPRVRPAPMFEDPERYVEADTVARAFASLNPRWQQTLWLTEVEQRSVVEVGEQLQLAPNAAAALTHRAREAFATAYLAEHLAAPPDEACRRHAARLAAYVRDQLTDVQRAEIEAHLAECPSCTGAVDDLRDLNASLRTLAPMTPSALTVPLAVGTSIGGAASTGLLSSGLLLKGAAVLLLVAPVVAVGVDSFSDATGSSRERTLVVAPTMTTAAAAASTLTTVLATSTSTPQPPPSSAPAMTPAPVRNATPSTNSVPGTAAPEPAATGAPVGAAKPVVDDVLTLVAPLFDDVVVPLVEGVVTTVLDVVQPLLDTVLVPAVGLVGTVGSLVTVELPVAVPSLPLTGVVTTAPMPTTTVPPPEVAPVTTGNAVPPAGAATVPSVTAATVTLPPVSVGPVTLPAATLPSVTLPPVTLPPVTAPLLMVVPTTVLDLLGQG
jgi:RNA polymerase sigma factor (sigma-70 family)